ncbi:hypothetical protein L2E82_48424 [Cichorium intybus]|uniref:Uncharacterized protein n=1 Tax=Cichorium intybus TaxID=13427 RepID=A0ACB8Z2B0_CICIN|nr:hypothetical protein L2E82_48424 [Cichorium intybus]
MAGAHGATIAAATITSSSVSPSTSAAPIPGKSIVLLSSLPSSFPSRRRRTNHLRQKILKTLENKPYPDIPEFPRKNPTIIIEETAQQQTAETGQFSVSQTTGFLDAIAGEFSTKSFAKIGLYLVGAFVFQTICAVLIFGWNDLAGEDENSNSDNHNKTNVLDSKENPNLLETKQDSIVLIDESEMDNRIMEIQEMARGAREQEKLEAKRKGLVEEEEDDVDHDLIDKTLKEKEVDGRLMKLRKSLEGNYEKLPPKFPTKEEDKGSISPPLMFKKKYKYKSPSIDSMDKPKGFDSTIDYYVVNDNEVELLDNNESVPVNEPINNLGNGIARAKRRATKTESESIAGTSKETRKPRGFGKESQRDTSISIKNDDFNSNGSLKGKKGNRKFSRNLGDMKSKTPTEFWWTSLPYVLAVLMQRGGNGEDSEGLFTLRSNSQNKNGLSHTVVFEDRGDATNFCYLLESFFQDLGDFTTNIIPVPTNELEEAVKSGIIKVVVVKKGQLELYVGQPLTDVESALRTLIPQDN